MIDTIFLCMIAIQGWLLFKYIKSLTYISSIDEDQRKLLRLTVLEESKLTSYVLLKDIKFFLCLLTKSYMKSDVETYVKTLLNRARCYLLLQYPVVAAIFLLPVIFKG